MRFYKVLYYYDFTTRFILSILEFVSRVLLSRNVFTYLAGYIELDF